MFRMAVLSLGVLLALSIWIVRPKASAAITNGTAAPDVAGENWLNSQPLAIAQCCLIPGEICRRATHPRTVGGARPDVPRFILHASRGAQRHQRDDGRDL